MTTEPPLTLDLAEGKRLLDNVQSFTEEETAAILGELPNYEGKVFGDGMRWHQFRKRAIKSLLSLAASAQETQERVDVLEFALEGSEWELQQAEGLLQEADRFAVHRGNRCVESDNPERCDCGYAEWRDQVDAVLTKEPQ